MTEYWVSQGNKWCDFCKIYIANNPLSIRTHELGQRHKDSVAKRLANMRKEKAAKEKEDKEAARALEQIEAKARRSYQKDLAALRENSNSNSQVVGACEEDPGIAKFSADSGDEWKFDSNSGYYYNQANGYYYDPNSGLYYSDATGTWVTQEKAGVKFQGSSGPKQKEGVSEKPVSGASGSGATGKYQSGPPPGLVVQGSVNPTRAVKGAASSIAINNKRKREDVKPKVISKEEADALKAREAARKRMEEREKPLLGLYKSY